MTPEPGAVATVLLVEDDGDRLDSLRRAFEIDPAFGEPLVARSLAEALDKLGAASPDLVIVAETLPDGVATRLLASASSELPVLVTSSHGSAEGAVRALQSGALDYVAGGVAQLADLPQRASRALREWSERVDRRSAEEALRRSEERYRALTEHTYDLLSEIDDGGIVLFASPNHQDVLGIDPAEFVGTSGLERVHPRDRDSLMSLVSELIDNGVVVQKSFRFQKGDGTWCWLEASARAYTTAGGEYRVVISSRDVSERRELEERLRQSQKLEAVGQLAGGIAHDFNNLLTVISGYGEYLVDALDPGSEECEAAQQIRTAAERSGALTRQLLAFSRSQVLQPQTLDLNEIVTDLGKMLWRLIGEDIQLSVLLDPSIGRIHADRGQIEQIIVNLTVNARDAMDKGGLLTIATSRARPGFIRLTVADSGHGMDEPTRERIFEPFFTTKQVGQGTGLGLSTVYGIVSQSGGSISVESEPGKGSRFDVELPVAGSKAESEIAVQRTPEERDAEAVGSILLVEDEPRVRKLLGRALERQGHRVIAAARGDQALEMASRLDRPVDLLVTDIVMPGMDGVALADALRQRWPETRVVFMSGHPERQGSGVVPRLPNDAALIQKPFRIDHLIRAVRDALPPAPS
ncbi:MAG: response regulator [Myxococcota bacterium]